MNEIEWKDLLKKAFKIILCIIVVFLIPFILPLLTRILIHFHIYEGIDEFKKYIEVFFNMYVVIYMIIVMIIVIAVICSKEKIEDFINRHDFHIKHKDTEIVANVSDIVKESDSKRNFVGNLSEKENLNNSNIKLEIQQELGIKHKKNNSDKKQKKIEDDAIKAELLLLKEENNNLRYYATYNIINHKTKELLNMVYCNKNMKLEDFKNELIRSFKNRNKNNANLTKKQKNEYANNKYETIKDGLQYLNIIEISDDNKIITLTQYGKEFVEKYIEKEVGENEN